jgi:hypothetical protein
MLSISNRSALSLSFSTQTVSEYISSLSLSPGFQTLGKETSLLFRVHWNR